MPIFHYKKKPFLNYANISWHSSNQSFFFSKKWKKRIKSQWPFMHNKNTLIIGKVTVQRRVRRHTFFWASKSFARTIAVKDLIRRSHRMLMDRPGPRTAANCRPCECGRSFPKIWRATQYRIESVGKNGRKCVRPVWSVW